MFFYSTEIVHKNRRTLSVNFVGEFEVKYQKVSVYFIVFCSICNKLLGNKKKLKKYSFYLIFIQHMMSVSS